MNTYVPPAMSPGQRAFFDAQLIDYENKHKILDLCEQKGIIFTTEICKRAGVELITAQFRGETIYCPELMTVGEARQIIALLEALPDFERVRWHRE